MERRLENLDFTGGVLLGFDKLAWILFILRKIGVTRAIHMICDFLDRKSPTEEMMQYRKIKKMHGKELRLVCQMLEDNKSKAVYMDIFKYRCNKESI